MSDMKCPFCGEKIEHIEDGWCNCKNRCTGSGSIDLWIQFIRTKKQLETTDLELDQLNLEKYDIEDELDRTRKALDVAVDALRRANNTYCAEEEDITIDLTESAAHKWQRTAYQMEMPISIALEQITALEQKE